MGDQQWPFMHETIKSFDFYTNPTTINKRATHNGNPNPEIKNQKAQEKPHLY